MALGLRTVPVVARGGDYIFGQSLRDVAGFLGIAMDGDKRRTSTTYVKRRPDERCM